MQPDQIAETYNKIAEHWDSPDFNYDNGIRQHERALTFAPQAGAALDVGCGASGRIIGLLLAKGYDVEGVDISVEMLRRARRRHPGVVFHEANVCVWELPQKYAFISAWDSIWHVPLAQQLPLIKKICNHLVPGGVLIFTTGGVEQADEITPDCFGQPLYHAAPGIPSLVQALGEAGCRCVHLEYDQYPENHVYLVAQRLESAP